MCFPRCQVLPLTFFLFISIYYSQSITSLYFLQMNETQLPKKFSINRVDKTAFVFYVLLLSNIVCTLASHYSETKAKAQYQQLLNFHSNCCHVARGRHSYFIYSISASVRFQLYFIHLSHNAGDAGSFVRRRCRRHPYLLHFLFLRRH